jgi:hypothetical protein
MTLKFIFFKKKNIGGVSERSLILQQKYNDFMNNQIV